MDEVIKKRTVTRKIKDKLVDVEVETAYLFDIPNDSLISLESRFGKREPKGNIRSGGNRSGSGNPYPREVPKIPKRIISTKIIPRLSMKKIKRNKRKS